VFLETVSNVDVFGNLFDQCRVTGLHINRIHGEPSGIMITGNRISATPIGASMTGDFGGVSFLGNHFSRFTIAALQFGLDGQGNISNVAASGNVFDCRGVTCPVVFGCAPKGVLSWIRVQGNYVYGTPRQDQLFVNTFGTNNDVHVGQFIGVQQDFRPNIPEAANSRRRLVPRHAQDTGEAGDTASDDRFMYVCTSLNRWKRVALTAW
jgi:hypothetical protein